MNLNAADKSTLRKAGFTIREIQTLDEAVDKSGAPQPVNIHSPAWQAAIQKRANFARQARTVYKQTHGKPLTKQHFNNIINQQFKGNIFDWLKLEYQPRKKTDFQEALKARLTFKKKTTQQRFKFGR